MQRRGDSDEDLARILEAAGRLGIEMDEEEAIQWLAAIAVSRSDQKVTLDVNSGVFGHKVTMLDFDVGELDYFRRVGELVEIQDQPGLVETALALSGSAAQSKIQSYPGDLDYFERVNIKAPTRDEACRILSRVMREKALSTLMGSTYRLIEVKFGSYPVDVKRGDNLLAAGSPIAWLPDEIQLGFIQAVRPDQTPVKIGWENVAMEPGWCKFDWVVADNVRRQIANASNMLDATWESPDGSITPLDGYLDPYFQEVYLEAESVPIFSKLVRHMSADALDDYVKRLEGEVEKYLVKDINYGKAAKRMYNIFRLTGRYRDAAFLRELFDEPTTMLYQVWTLIRTIEEASVPGSDISVDTILAQADQLIISVVDTLEGDQETEIVRHLLRLRDSVASGGERAMQSQRVEAARSEVINIVNNFFYQKLTAVPTIKSYMDSIKDSATESTRLH